MSSSSLKNKGLFVQFVGLLFLCGGPRLAHHFLPRQSLSLAFIACIVIFAICLSKGGALYRAGKELAAEEAENAGRDPAKSPRRDAIITTVLLGVIISLVAIPAGLAVLKDYPFAKANVLPERGTDLASSTIIASGPLQKADIKRGMHVDEALGILGKPNATITWEHRRTFIFDKGDVVVDHDKVSDIRVKAYFIHVAEIEEIRAVVEGK